MEENPARTGRYSGIPQGSFAVFNIYYNDLPSIVSSPIIMFADDAKIF